MARAGRCFMVGRMGARACAAVLAGVLALAPGSVQAGEAPNPLSVDASALVDTLAVAGGGVGHGTRVLARADLRAHYDGTGGALPWLSGLIDVAAINGKSVSALAGDVQGVSNIEFDRTVRVVNAWVKASSTHAALKLGIIDSNLDFDEQNVGALFLHSSHGMGPEMTGAGLDGAGSSPDTTLGAVVSVFDGEAGWKLRAGVFNGRPGDPARPGSPSFAFSRDIGALAIGEADWSGSWGRIAVGGWHFTSTLSALDGSGNRRGASGGFVTVEPTLIDRKDGLQVKGWVRAALGDADTDVIRGYLGGGLAASGFWAAFPQDALGFAVAHARLNHRAGPGAGAETAFEWTAQHRLNGWLTVQPDVQWVVNPGGFGGVGNALVLGLRMIVTKGLL
ncbi:MAG: carbohydrate porin [Sphingomonadales bacterium]|nr:carbohydrate porin [Sphingomonadales bacterium]